MNIKKLILLYFVVAISLIDAGIVHHTLISVAEQKIMGHLLKHVMVSGGAEKDEFFIDGHTVTQDRYQQEFDRLQQKEREEELLQQQVARRSRIEFADAMQVEIAAKLLNKILAQITQIFTRINNPALIQFFVFSKGTIDSQDQLMQLRDFTQQLQVSIQDKIVQQDFEGLHLLFTKLEHWPTRLEKFFQDTVQNAIKKSDDTIMLKELLKLVSESSLIN
ncbi:MAG: hypothetical protein Q8Q60_00080 [Candidatus Chromulinivorax sp.]|nr:hypothetical protein [Candidatus Chromulinivorax sp.]